MATASLIIYGISLETDISVEKQENKIGKEENWGEVVGFNM